MWTDGNKTMPLICASPSLNSIIVVATAGMRRTAYNSNMLQFWTRTIFLSGHSIPSIYIVTDHSVLFCCFFLKEVIQTYNEEEEENNNDDNQTQEVGNGFFLPAEVYKSLYPYQLEGVLWFWQLYKQKQGGILGDDMGWVFLIVLRLKLSITQY